MRGVGDEADRGGVMGDDEQDGGQHCYPSLIPRKGAGLPEISCA